MSRRKLILSLTLASVVLAGGAGWYLYSLRDARNRPVSVPKKEKKPDASDPTEEAIVDLQLPTGAQVRLNGEKSEEQHRLVVRSLADGQWSRHQLAIDFPTGASEQHTLLMRPGQHLRLARTLPARNRPDLMLQTGHNSAVIRSAFNPSGTRVFTLGTDQRVLEWDVSTGRQLRVLLHDATAGPAVFPFGALDVSSKGHLLVARGGVPVLIDLKTGKVIGKHKSTAKSMMGAVFHPEGNSFAAVADGKVVIWDTDSNEPRKTIGTKDMGSPRGLAFSPDGQKLLTYGGGNVVILDPQTGKQLQTLPVAHQTGAAFSPDGKHVATASSLKKNVSLWEVANGKRVREFVDESVILGFETVDFSPDGTTLAGAGAGPTVCIWDVESGKILTHCLGHTANSVVCLTYSRDGKRLLTGDSNGAALVFHAQSGTLQQKLQGRLAQVTSASFSADGSTLLLTADGNPVRLSPGNQQIDTLFPGHDRPPHSGIFSADGAHFLTLSHSHQVFLWETATGRRIRSFPTLRPTAGAFSPDGRRALIGTEDGTAALWDVATETVIARFEGHRKRINSVTISADGNHALTCSEDGQVIRWSTATGLQRRVYEIKQFDRLSYKEKIPDLKPFPFTDASLSPDGQTVLTIGNGQSLLWDAETGLLRTQLGLTPKEISAEMIRYARAGRKTEGLLTRWSQSAFGATAAAFSPDGTHAATASTFGLGDPIVLWNVNTRRAVKGLGGEEPGKNRAFRDVRSLAFSSDGRRLLAGRSDGSAVLLDVNLGKPIQTFQRSKDGRVDPTGLILEGNAAALSPDGRIVLTVGGPSPTLWDATTGKVIRELPRSSRRSIFLGFNPTGSRVVLRGPGHQLDIWDFDTRQRVGVLPNEAKDPGCSWHPTKQQVLTWGSDNNVRLCDATTGKIVLQLKDGHKGEVRNAAFSRDGNWVVTKGEDKSVLLWELKTGRSIVTLSGFANPVSALAVSDGTHVLTGDSKGNVILWDNKGKQIWKQVLHRSWVESLTFSPDGTSALSSSDDGKAVLLDVKDGTTLQAFAGHLGTVSTARFSPDGQLIVTSAQDGVRLWEVATGLELARLAMLQDRNEVVVVTPDGLFDGSRKGRELVTFRLKASGSVVALDRLFADYYHPDLLNELLRGSRPLPGRALTEQNAPLVRLLINPDGVPTEPQFATVDVAVTDRGAGVNGPWIYHNRSRLNLTGKVIRREGETTVHRFSVALVPGENRIEAQATTANRKQESDPAIVTLNHQLASTPPRLFVLVVGISQYAALSDLPFAAKDADSMAELFKTQFARGFSETHVQKLTGKGEATRDAILQALEAWKDAGPNDTVVLYAACHGRSQGQRYYLLPYEFRKENPENPAADFRRQGLSIDDLGDSLAKVKALKRVLIFDTCYSGAAVGGVGKRSPFAFRGAAERLRHAYGVYCLSATSASELAVEHEDLKHGLLTYALLAACGRVEQGPLVGRAAPAPDKGRDMDVLEWFHYARRHVPKLYKELAGRDHAVVLSGDELPGFALLHVQPGKTDSTGQSADKSDPDKTSPKPALGGK